MTFILVLLFFMKFILLCHIALCLGDDPHAALKSGVALCGLMNALKPKSVGKINTKKLDNNPMAEVVE